MKGNMALINCPECGKEIPDKAQNCPSCGCPIQNTITTGQSISPQQPQQIQTIQANLKKWKLIQLFGLILFVIGIVSLYSLLSSDAKSEPTYQGVTTGLGIIFFAVGKFGAWWHNK
jgi:uncharacterized membrane protein YvbJ